MVVVATMPSLRLFRTATLLPPWLACWLAATSCSPQRSSRAPSDHSSRSVAASEPISAGQFFKQWKVQFSSGNTGAGAYEHIEEQNLEEWAANFTPNEGYTELLLTIRNQDEDPQSMRKPRVELRELNGYGEPASWSQSGNHHLFAEVRVLRESLNGKNRNIIVLQSHTDGSGPGRTNKMASGIYFRPDKNKFECKTNNGSNTSYYDLKRNVHPGKQWYQFALQVQDGRSRCGVYSTTEWDWTPFEDIYDGNMYFKTGNYTQPGDEMGPAPDSVGTQVQIRNFVVGHE